MKPFRGKLESVKKLKCLTTARPRPRSTAAAFARIQSSPKRPLAFGAKPGAGKRARKLAMSCVCHHPKSIHARMYANQELGTPCNYPGCRCKAYKSA
jgi:hypothetical protein